MDMLNAFSLEFVFKKLINEKKKKKKKKKERKEGREIK